MKKSEFTALWKQYEPMIKGIVELFHPFVEAAVHDLERGKVVAIYHNISQRMMGDPSPLKEFQVKTEDFPDYFPPYYKENWDGRALKCTSITLRDEKGKAVGLICINMDASHFQEGHRLLSALLNIEEKAEHPMEIYSHPFKELAQAMIQEFLDEKKLVLNRLSRDQKKDLVHYLYRRGLFNFKKAAPFIAKKLGNSRATVYNYIKNMGDLS